MKVHITNKLIQNALWQAYAHCELDDLANMIVPGMHTIDGNDHPVLVMTARKLAQRIRDESLDDIEDDSSTTAEG